MTPIKKGRDLSRSRRASATFFFIQIATIPSPTALPDLGLSVTAPVFEVRYHDARSIAPPDFSHPTRRRKSPRRSVPQPLRLGGIISFHHLLFAFPQLRATPEASCFEGLYERHYPLLFGGRQQFDLMDHGRGIHNRRIRSRFVSAQAPRLSGSPSASGVSRWRTD